MTINNQVFRAEALHELLVISHFSITISLNELVYKLIIVYFKEWMEFTTEQII